jgi:hypothetical protein
MQTTGLAEAIPSERAKLGIARGHLLAPKAHSHTSLGHRPRLLMNNAPLALNIAVRFFLDFLRPCGYNLP